MLECGDVFILDRLLLKLLYYRFYIFTTDGIYGKGKRKGNEENRNGNWGMRERERDRAWKVAIDDRLFWGTGQEEGNASASVWVRCSFVSLASAISLLFFTFAGKKKKKY